MIFRAAWPPSFVYATVQIAQRWRNTRQKARAIAIGSNSRRRSHALPVRSLSRRQFGTSREGAVRVVYRGRLESILVQQRATDTLALPRHISKYGKLYPIPPPSSTDSTMQETAGSTTTGPAACPACPRGCGAAGALRGRPFMRPHSFACCRVFFAPSPFIQSESCGEACLWSALLWRATAGRRHSRSGTSTAARRGAAQRGKGTDRRACGKLAAAAVLLATPPMQPCRRAGARGVRPTPRGHAA